MDELVRETPGDRLARYERSLQAMKRRREEYLRLGVTQLADMEAHAIRNIRAAIHAEQLRIGFSF